MVAPLSSPPPPPPPSSSSSSSFSSSDSQLSLVSQSPSLSHNSLPPSLPPPPPPPSRRNLARPLYTFASASDPPQHLARRPVADTYCALHANDAALLTRKARAENQKWQQLWSPDRLEEGSSGRAIHDRPQICGRALCSCAAGLTADCAAVCCCPCAVLNLFTLAFIKLPIVVAWKILVKLKKKFVKKRAPPDAHKVETPSPAFTPSWSFKESPDREDPWAPVVHFDSQKLWKHFESGYWGLGGTFNSGA